MSAELTGLEVVHGLAILMVENAAVATRAFHSHRLIDSSIQRCGT